MKRCKTNKHRVEVLLDHLLVLPDKIEGVQLNSNFRKTMSNILAFACPKYCMKHTKVVAYLKWKFN